MAATFVEFTWCLALLQGLFVRLVQMEKLRHEKSNHFLDFPLLRATVRTPCQPRADSCPRTQREAWYLQGAASTLRAPSIMGPAGHFCACKTCLPNDLKMSL
ncbi:E3 Ubiquitin-Protein Ligase Mib1 [Manis pentadactyla]|nr:E3 Ubiquitin-Protein Ligase Mib1 [Manis pentadactyla]